MSGILTEFINKLELSDKDRQELHSKRGLTDEVIDAARIRTGSFQAVRAALDAMKTSDAALVDAGLMESRMKQTKFGPRRKLIPRHELTENRLLIPYMDNERNVTSIRPHKLYVKGATLKPYCDLWLSGDASGPVVITEGEFKTLALHVCGLRSIAVPGITSFGGRKFDEFKEFLSTYGVKEVVVAYDREDKSRTSTDWRKRHEASYWGWRMAVMLRREGFNATIATIPDAWMQESKNEAGETVWKADFDDALGRGYAPETIRACICNAVQPHEYLKSLTGDEAYVVRRKAEAFWHRSQVTVDFGRYVWQKMKDGEVVQEDPISNFTMSLDSEVYRGEDLEVDRMVTIKSQGRESVPAEISPRIQSSARDFRAWALAKGPYHFSGSQGQLNEVSRHMDVHSIPRRVYEPQVVGRVDDHRIPGTPLWVSEDLVIDLSDGEQHPSDEDGVMGRGSIGYRPPSGVELPKLRRTDVTSEHIFKVFTDQIGMDAYLYLGWAVASIYSTAIHSKWGAFPILHLSGQRSAGKTTYGKWLTRMFGFKSEPMTAKSTDKAIQRTLGQRADCPVLLDDYRVSGGDRLESTLRAAYNRQGYWRAAFSNDNQTLHTESRATVILAGEELPVDSALVSRCIRLYFREEGRKVDRYVEIERMALDGSLTALVLDVLQRYHETEAEVLKRTEEAREELEQETGDARTALNYAVIVGALLGSGLIGKEKANEIIAYIGVSAMTAAEEKRGSGPLEEWMELFNICQATYDGRGPERLIDERCFVYDHNEVIIALQKANDQIEGYVKRKGGEPPFNYRTILAYMKGASDEIEMGRDRFMGVQLRSVRMPMEVFKELGGEIQRGF